VNRSPPEPQRVNRTRFARFLVDHAIAVALINLLLFFFLAFGASQLQIASGIRVLFSPQDPNLIAEIAIEEEFGREKAILMVVDAHNESVFSSNNLQTLETMTESAWQVPYSRRVDSVINFLHATADQDEIFVNPLIENAASLSDAEIAEKREIALGEDLLIGRLLSSNGSVAAININLALPDAGTAEALADAVNNARNIAAKAQAQNPNLTVQLAGLAITEQLLAEVTAGDGASLIPLLFVIVLVTLAFLLRSPLASVSTIVVIILSVAAGMGFAGWSGLKINSVSVSAPTIIMTLAVADCIHLLSSFVWHLGAGLLKRQALEQAILQTFYPIVLTSVTTAIGFLRMNFSDSPPFAELGTISAAGVLGALWAAMTILPALILMLPFKSDRKDPRSLPLTAAADWIIRHQNPVFWSSLAISLFAISFVPRMVLTDNPAGYFSEEVPITAAVETIETKLSGVQNVHYVLNAGEPGGVAEPQFLADVARFVEWLRQQPEVTNVDSFIDTLMHLNQLMHGDDPAWHQLPASRDLAAQYLLLYEISVPYGQDVTHQISADKTALKVTAVLKNQKSALIAFEQRSRNWLAQHAPALETRGAGYDVSFAHIGRSNIDSMLWGSLFAIVLLSGCLLIAFRSARFGVLSLVPNLFPALISLGVWSALVHEVNMAASVVFSATLGIVVDDTTHFLVKYRYLRIEQDYSPAQAVRETFATVGHALVTTSLVLTAGFLVLVQSDFSVNSTSGILMSMTIMVALLLDMIFLPTLLIKADRWLVPAKAP